MLVFPDPVGLERKIARELFGVGNAPVQGDLAAFASTYASVKRHAKTNQAASFPLTLRSGGGARQASLPMPPSIKSFLNEGL